MADRLPPETIELVLSLAFDPPDAEDVDLELERKRRELLRSASVVCRRWRLVAMAMLPRSVVIGTADELQAHVAAHLGRTLDVGRTTCLTVACLDASDVEETSLRSLALSMPQLHYLRLACAASFCGRQLLWPGRHLVVGEHTCLVAHGHIQGASDRTIMRILDTSPSFQHLSMLTEAFYGTIGAAFGARVETLRCGEVHAAFYRQGDAGALLQALGDGHLGRLRSVRYFGDDFLDAVETITGEEGSVGGVATCPALMSVRVGFTNIPSGPALADYETSYAIELLQRLPTACSRLVCEWRSSSLTASVACFLDILARAIGSANPISIRTLIVVVDSLGLDEAWRASDAVVALERACAARGIAVEVRI